MRDRDQLSLSTANGSRPKFSCSNDERATPALVVDDGKDFVPTNRWMAFGHHFAAIAGPGPLVGPVLAAQFGFLPGTLWILIGATLGGGVHDMIVLFASVRRRGKTLGQMVKEEIGSAVGALALVSVLAIMIILLAVLALVVVQALAKSPWGVFHHGDDDSGRADHGNRVCARGRVERRTG